MWGESRVCLLEVSGNALAMRGSIAPPGISPQPSALSKSSSRIRSCPTGLERCVQSVIKESCLFWKLSVVRQYPCTDAAARLANKGFTRTTCILFFKFVVGQKLCRFKPKQLYILLLLLLRVSQAAIHVDLGVNHEVIENMQRWLEQIRHDHVIKQEKEIVLGKSSTWAEGDEDRADETHHALWEQRSGLVQRGKPETLILSPLILKNTFSQLVPYNGIICLICSTVLNGWLWNHLTKIIVLTEFVFHAVCTDDTHKNGRLSGG